MRALTVALLGNLEYASELGKRSTESDVGLHTFREGDANVSTVVPIRYPEKPQPLVFAVNAADVALIVVRELNRELGESILAADAAGVKKAFLVLQNYVTEDQVAPLLKGTGLEGAEVLEDKPPLVRARLAEVAEEPVPETGAPARVDIDHHFHVKGIGAVVLGFVKGGNIERHGQLQLFPTTKVAQVRSIQVHDEDVNEAGPGSHVGLALKQVDNDDLDRGFVLAPADSLRVTQKDQPQTLGVTVSRYHKQGVETGRVYYLGIGWQWVPVKVVEGKVAPGDTNHVSVTSVKPYTFHAGDVGVLVDMDAGGQRIVGRVVPA